MVDGCHHGGRGKADHRIEHVADEERVPDEEHDPLGAVEHDTEPAGESVGSASPALSSAGCGLAR